jgi:hypothetical protein
MYLAGKKTLMQKFEYSKSFLISYWGCSFDSLLELKYAISIQEDYEFLRAQVPIYYNLKTKLPARYISRNSRRYTPDFLIRHKNSFEAFLVEIKPRAFQNDKRLLLLKEVAENYIRLKSFDWSFTFVYDDQIQLNFEQEQQFQACCRLKFKSFCKPESDSCKTVYEDNIPSFFKKVPGNRQKQFVLYGH